LGHTDKNKTVIVQTEPHYTTISCNTGLNHA